MTENEIKEMLLDIINNGAEYECRFEGDRGDPPFNNKEWIPYNLGEEIHIDWGYRKVEKWYVFDYEDNDYRIFKDNDDCAVPCVFEGTREECEKWVEVHTKSWLEEYIKNEPLVMNSERGIAKKSIQAVCKKIMEEVSKNSTVIEREGIENWYIAERDISEIIKGLGVDL